MSALTSYLPQAYAPSPGVALAATAKPMALPDTGGLKEASPAQRARAQKTAQDFEASFLSSMFGQMFEGTEVSEPFGGGQGEQAFRSFMTDAMGKSMARHGGIGLSKSVAAEMLKLQGLK
jgi:peptidoglycan hydrolase FlgJ